MRLSLWSASVACTEPWVLRSPPQTPTRAFHPQSHHSRGRGWETEVQAHSLPHSTSEVLLRSISPEPVSKLKKRNKRASYINQDHP